MLILVGTLHRVKEAAQALGEFLTSNKPDLISVEISPYSLSFRKRRKELLPKLSSSLRLFLEIPYEYEVARTYASKHQIPLIPIDLCYLSKRFLREASGLFKRPLREEPLLSFEGHVGFVKKVWDDKTLGGLLSKRLDPKRERALALRIRKLFQHHPKRMIHIGGWIHMLDVPGTLYHFLKDLNPTRFLILPREKR
jgi:hypothetical protein